MGLLILGKEQFKVVSWNCRLIPGCSVSSAVVQRYFSHILDASLSQNLKMQAVAIDILSFVIKQGLTHPMQVR